jgi:DNA-binding HxlR family transcriptional regulator
MKRTKIMGIETTACKESRMAMRDAVELLSGKWKFSILMELATTSPLRFKDLQEVVPGISPKVLSNELYELEQNLLITRTVNNTRPVTVSYALTKYAYELQPVLLSLIEFGRKHGKKIREKK